MKPDDLHHNDPHAQVLEDAQRRQRNTSWPDAMVNSGSVDALLWKGSPKATKVQRVGIVVWGLSFLSVGICLLLMARERHDRITAIVGAFSFAVGAKITVNAFRRPSKGKRQRSSRNQ